MKKMRRNSLVRAFSSHQKKINVTKAKVNMLAFDNIFKVSEDELRKKDHAMLRLMKMKWKERSVAIWKGIYYQASNDRDRTPTVDEFFNRFNDSQLLIIIHVCHSHANNFISFQRSSAFIVSSVDSLFNLDRLKVVSVVSSLNVKSMMLRAIN